MEWVAINPGIVLGPVFEEDSSASVQIVAKLLRGEFPGLPRFGYAVVDVRDLADLEVRAMTAPQAAGQRYIGSDPFISMSEIASVLKKRLGDKAKSSQIIPVLQISQPTSSFHQTMPWHRSPRPRCGL